MWGKLKTGKKLDMNSGSIGGWWVHILVKWEQISMQTSPSLKWERNGTLKVFFLVPNMFLIPLENLVEFISFCSIWFAVLRLLFFISCFICVWSVLKRSLLPRHHAFLRRFIKERIRGEIHGLLPWRIRTDLAGKQFSYWIRRTCSSFSAASSASSHCLTSLNSSLVTHCPNSLMHEWAREPLFIHNIGSE